MDGETVWGEIVTVVNRSSHPLTATFNGKHYVLQPGENKYPLVVAFAARRQNPRMGSEHPMNPNRFDSLVGIVEHGDPITPLEQSDAIERMDRSKLAANLQGTIEPSVIAGIDRYMVSGGSGSVDSGFVSDRR